MSYRDVFRFDCDNPACKVSQEVDSDKADTSSGPEGWIVIQEVVKRSGYYGNSTEYRHFHTARCVLAYFKARDEAAAAKKKAAAERKAAKAAGKTTAKSTAKKTTGRKSTARKSTRRKSTRRR